METRRSGVLATGEYATEVLVKGGMKDVGDGCDGYHICGKTTVVKLLALAVGIACSDPTIGG